MNIFKKQIKFVSAICPECKGRLELDSNLKIAYCQYCGSQCIVENAPKPKKNESRLETVLNFVERQQSLQRQDKAEKERKKEQSEQKREQMMLKYWWAMALFVVLLLAFTVVMSILEAQGII